MVVIIVGRFSRIINPIDQIIITKSDDGKTMRAVTKNGDILSVKKKVNDLGYAVYINEKGIDSGNGVALQQARDGSLSLIDGLNSGMRLIDVGETPIKPTGFSIYFIAKNASPFKIGIKEAIVSLAIFFFFAKRSIRGGVGRWMNQNLSSMKENLAGVDYAFFGLLAIIASANPVGCDIDIIAKSISNSNTGIDIYAAQIAKKISDNFPYPAYPYTPLSLSILSPIQWVNDELYSPLLSIIFGRSSSSGMLGLLSVIFFYIINFTILNELSLAGVIRARELRKYLYLTTLCPGPLYLIAGFQQIDILAVLFFCQGLLLFRYDRDRWVGSILIAIGLAIKPQNLLLAPVVSLFLVHASIGRDLKEITKNLICGLLILVFYGLCFYLSQSKSYVAVISGFSIVERLYLSLFDISPDLKIYSVPVFVFVTLSYVLSAWRPSVDRAWLTSMSALLATSALICAYQASFVHTPGLSIFMTPAITIVMACSSFFVDWIWIMLISFLAVSSWPLTFPGDLTRYFTDVGYNAVLGGYPESNHEQYYSFLYTAEFVGLITLVTIFTKGICKLRDIAEAIIVPNLNEN